VGCVLFCGLCVVLWVVGCVLCCVLCVVCCVLCVVCCVLCVVLCMFVCMFSFRRMLNPEHRELPPLDCEECGEEYFKAGWLARLMAIIYR